MNRVSPLSFLLYSIAVVAFVALVGCGDSSSEPVDGGGADAGAADMRSDTGGADSGGTDAAGADLAGADTSGADAGSDLAVDTGQPCCTAAVCAAMGMVCNTDTCVCEAS